VFSHDGRILVFDGFDRSKDSWYFRPLGGGIEFGEGSDEAMRRETREELGCGVEDLRLLGVIENRFVLEGEPGHEIVFVYDGVLEDRSLYGLEAVPWREQESGEAGFARWLGLEAFRREPRWRLVPEELEGLLTKHGLA
jgi:8-oxo-dGTP pyrophosphatase MutT (NUDIX family)